MLSPLPHSAYREARDKIGNEKALPAADSISGAHRFRGREWHLESRRSSHLIGAAARTPAPGRNRLFTSRLHDGKALSLPPTGNLLQLFKSSSKANGKCYISGREASLSRMQTCKPIKSFHKTHGRRAQ